MPRTDDELEEIIRQILDKSHIDDGTVKAFDSVVFELVEALSDEAKPDGD